MKPTNDEIGCDYDVVVLGGAFSGAVAGILLRRWSPTARVLIVERSTEFKRKVGESTSEVAGCFLTRVLGLGGYLAREQVTKHGLRMWFNRAGNEALETCSEIGPKWQVRLPTYQLNRTKLDSHLLGLAETAGCEVARPATVRSCELGGEGNNTIELKSAENTYRVSARWVVDASGKAAFIARQRDTLRPLDGHPTHSMWTRFRGVRDLDDPALLAMHGEFADAAPAPRSQATNHLMGPGWWCWIIPLASGEVSAGLTWDSRVFTPPPGGSPSERLQAHLVGEPIGRWMFGDAEAVESDTNHFSKLPYYNDEVTGDGWACVGDACGFMDPLYSQGLDYCAHSTYSVCRFVSRSLNGERAVAAAGQAEFARQFKQSYFRWYEALYRDKYYYLGDAELMYAAFLMDVGTYFIGPVRLVYEKMDAEFSSMPYGGVAGALFARFMAFYNARLVAIAKKRLAAGAYGGKNLGRRYLVPEGFSPETGAAGRLILRGMRTWLACEVKALFLRPLQSGAASLTWDGASAKSAP